jgi:hypothetical protein
MLGKSGVQAAVCFGLYGKRERTDIGNIALSNIRWTLDHRDILRSAHNPHKCGAPRHLLTDARGSRLLTLGGRHRWIHRSSDEKVGIWKLKSAGRRGDEKGYGSGYGNLSA